MQPQERTLHYEIPCRLWDVVCLDIFIIHGGTLLCIVDYHSKLPIVKKINSLSAGDLVHMTKLIFEEYKLPKKVVSDAGTNFIADTFKAFCMRINIQQTMTSSYFHQSNGQVEACIKFVTCTVKYALTLLRDIHLALLQICSTTIGVGVLRPAVMLFIRPIRGLLPQMNRDPIDTNNDYMHNKA